ncbi:Ig-like domain-containing protein [Rodentibacter haemolyticus]|uniref:Ig-like domain-containing protein n=1 Tax=Rodentibacter haemolyticus TaxID=2778911 RepID=A0ABX6UZV9_9PAST|nr:Ig-like domain-containing protein [Rodentibacter haemolyticus]QPB43387.1 Ig-like domain-containing protein [Rodentibacter haemolyticus]
MANFSLSNQRILYLHLRNYAMAVLHIIKQNHLEKISLPKQQQIRLNAETDTQYQLVDENGQVIDNIKAELVGDDLTIVLENEQTTLVLENYKTAYPVESQIYLTEQNAAVEKMAEASQVVQATEVISLKHLAIFGLSALAIGGAFLIAKNRGNGGSSSAEQPKQEEIVPPTEEQPKQEEIVPPAEQPKQEEIAPPAEQPKQEEIAPPAEQPKQEDITPPAEQPKQEEIAPPAEQPKQEEIAPPAEQPKQEEIVPPAEQPKQEEIAPPAEQPKQEEIAPPAEQPKQEEITPPAEQPKQEEITPPVEPTTPPIQPTIKLNEVAEDNILNINESQSDILISGVTSNIIDGSSVILTVGDTEIATSVENNRFSAFIPGIILAKTNQIKATVQLTDNAGNPISVSEEKTYEVNTELPAVNITIDPINQGKILNQADQAKEILISGNIELENGVQILEVQVTIGQDSRVAQVNGNEWSISVLGQDLTSAIKPAISVKAIVQNAVGNIAEKTKQQDYEVDITPPSAALTLNDITADNIINLAESKGNITISGKVSGEVKAGDVVTLTVGDQAVEKVALSTSGDFSLEVEASKLTHGTAVTASLVISDNAGNEATISQTKAYEVDLEIDTPEITLTVANDNFINVNEGKTDVVVSGSVKNIADGAKVQLKLGEFSQEVDVQNGQFSTTISKEVMLANRAISATAVNTDNAGNRAEKTETQAYEVDPNLVAGIQLTKIGEAFSTELSGTTRISGTVEFDGVYAQGQNPRMLRAVNVVIGEKTYTTGFDGKTKSFYLDIPNEELAQLNGQTVSINFLNRKEISHTAVSDTDPVNLFENVHTLEKQDDGSYQLKNLGGTYQINQGITWQRVEVQVKSFNLESSGLNANNQVEIQPNKAQITGRVDGSAKAGDQVVVKIGDQTFETQVKTDRTFLVEVDPAQLAKQESVQAVLKTQDIAGKMITVQAVENYTTPNVVSAEFVSQREVAKADRKTDHTKEDYNFPYFINGLLIDPDMGINTSLPVGGNKTPLVIKYHFMTAEEAKNSPIQQDSNQEGPKFEAGVYFDYDDALKARIRQAYKVYEEYLNIQFVETNNAAEAQARHYLGQAPVDLVASGSVGHTQNVGLLWNKTNYDVNTQQLKLNNQIDFTNIHEIGHNYHLGHTEYSDPQTGLPTPIAGFENEANVEFSVMSYNGFLNANPIVGLRMSDYSPMRPFDLATLHYRYGVNPNSRAGNDTYGFRDYNGLETDGALYIWDGGGVDTFDASNENIGVNVDLTPGSWIYRGTERKQYFLAEGSETLSAHEYFGLDAQAVIHGKFAPELSFGPFGVPSDSITFHKYVKDQAFIGFGTQIENLIGSAYDDVLTGNNADNNIQGGAGNDIIRGGAGNDYLNGGEGNDQMYGGAGDDTFVVDNVGDSVIENANEGTDTVISSVDYTLSENIENLTLIGTTAKQATGNTLDNVLTANNIGNTLNGGEGNDRLIGGLGDDTLTGGAGNDTFVFQTELNGNIDTITDFDGGDKIALSSVIFTALKPAMANFDDYIQYDSASGKLSYDADGQGGRDAVHFANLNTGLTLNQNQYEIV